MPGLTSPSSVEMGESEGITSTSRIRLLEANPLLIGQVVAHVFEFLPSSTLQTTRLVCLLWNTESKRILFKNGRLTLRIPQILQHSDKSSLHIERQDQLKSAIQTLVSHSTSKSDSLGLLIHDCQSSSYILEDIPSFHSRITRLVYMNVENGQDPPVDMEHLAKFLPSLQNLKIFQTTCLNLSTEQSWLKSVSEESESGESTSENDSVKLRKFLDKLNSLKEIRLNFWLDLPTLTTLVNFKDRFQSVNQLQIDSEQVLSIYADQVAGEWKIQNVHLIIHNEIPLEVVRHFLRSVSTTLRHLRLTFCLRKRLRRGGGGDPYLWEIADRFCASCPIPWTLHNLRSLEIEDESLELESIIWKTFGVALELPLLKKLIIRSTISTQFEEMIRTWVRSRHRQLENGSLEEVQIYPKCLATAGILTVGCWPNLKVLVMSLEINEVWSTSKVFSAIFGGMDKLERLELILKDDHGIGREFSQLNLDELIVGVGRTAGFLSGQKIVRREEGGVKSIRNLKLLKSLKLECDYACELHRYSDYIIYDAIIHMESLQSFSITRNYISEKAMKDFQDKVGPHVHTNFYNLPKSYVKNGP